MKTIPWIPLLAIAVITFSGCSEDEPLSAPEPTPLANPTLLALGDSYTVGHFLPSKYSWPEQLADSLSAIDEDLGNLDVVAKTGWTTGDLLFNARIQLWSGALQDQPYGAVTLMIGVNNQYQGVDIGLFEAELDSLVDYAVDRAGGVPGRVLAFSIPDYSVTPVGQYFDTRQVSLEIRAHNEVLARVMERRGIELIDITPLSLLAGSEPGLVSKDGLHYTRAMYSRWVSLMLPAIESRIKGDLF